MPENEIEGIPLIRSKFLHYTMDENTKKIIKQIDEISLEILNFCKLPHPSGDYELRDMDNARHYTALYTRISALIDRIAPKDSPYYLNAQPFLKECGTRVFRGWKCDSELIKLLGILESLKEAYLSGYFQKINEQINAEIFADFLEMAEFFLSKGEQWKNAAAFLIGGVLEEHLRKLSIKNNIPIKKGNDKFVHAEDLNIELRKNSVYNEIERKQITTLLGIRNDADHAHWDSYTKEKVELMLLEVTRIISQYPA